MFSPVYQLLRRLRWLSVCYFFWWMLVGSAHESTERSWIMHPSSPLVMELGPQEISASSGLLCSESCWSWMLPSSRWIRARLNAAKDAMRWKKNEPRVRWILRPVFPMRELCVCFCCTSSSLGHHAWSEGLEPKRDAAGFYQAGLVLFCKGNVIMWLKEKYARLNVGLKTG